MYLFLYCSLHSFVARVIVEAHTSPKASEAQLYWGRCVCVQKWFPPEQHNGQCRLCQHLETLNYLLNSCHSRSTEYTWRHNIIAQRMANEIQNKFEPDSIKQSGIIEVEGLSADNQRYKPDIVARIDNIQKYIIVEVTK